MDRTWKPTAGGVLSIISGILEIILGVGIMFWGSLVGTLGERWQDLAEIWPDWGAVALIPPDALSMITTGALIIGIVMLVIGIIALVGGIHAIRRRRWGLALAGAILSFPFLPLGGILGLLAIIFVSLGKGEFE
jgi:uncharacterized membrane protein HdeD (DUF308 family)